MFKKLQASLAFFIFVSILFHFIFWSGLKLSPKKIPTTEKEQIEVTYLDDEQLKSSQDLKSDSQIVEQNEDPLNDEIPEDSKYLGKNNQRVKTETRAAKTGKFNNQAGGAISSQKEISKNDIHNEESLEKDSQNKNIDPSLLSLSDLSPNFNYKAPPPVPAKKLNNGQVSQTDDYLNETKIGLQTLLSTKEFVFYSYYSRIKEKIRQHWEPSVRQNVRMAIRRGRTIASVRDRVTRVLITLDSKGELIDVKVLSQSGVVELDQSAIDAFRAAAPFPNPPQGMIESDGTIKIHWDFILEASYLELKPSKGILIS